MTALVQPQATDLERQCLLWLLSGQLGSQMIGGGQWIVEDQYLEDLLLAPCTYCGSRTQALDHIIPRFHGGANDWENLTPACTSCNSEKGTRSLLGFLGQRVARHDLTLLSEQRVLWTEVGGAAA